jgi:hypothetical protein
VFASAPKTVEWIALMHLNHNITKDAGRTFCISSETADVAGHKAQVHSFV